MLSLPRGTFQGGYNVALSSAEWENPQVVERLAFRGEALLFLGAIPYADNWKKLSEFHSMAEKVVKKIEESNLPPLKRARPGRKP